MGLLNAVKYFYRLFYHHSSRLSTDSASFLPLNLLTVPPNSTLNRSLEELPVPLSSIEPLLNLLVRGSFKHTVNVSLNVFKRLLRCGDLAPAERVHRRTVHADSLFGYLEPLAVEIVAGVTDFLRV